MEVVLSWNLLFSTCAWHSIRFSTQAPLHALFIPVLIGLCSYKNVLTIWGHSRWKFTFTQIVSLWAFLLFWPPFWILKRVAAVHLFPDSRSPFPVPRSPFPVPRSPFPVLVTSFSRSYGKSLFKHLDKFTLASVDCRSVIRRNFRSNSNLFYHDGSFSKTVQPYWQVHSCEKSYSDFHIAVGIIVLKHFQVSDTEIWWKSILKTRDFTSLRSCSSPQRYTYFLTSRVYRYTRRI